MRRKITRSRTVLALALFLTLTLAACGGDDGDAATPTAPPVPENRAPTADFTFEPEAVPRSGAVFGDPHRVGWTGRDGDGTENCALGLAVDIS